MPGPTPKPRDQRKRRNKDEGTSSTSITLPAQGGSSLAADPENAELVKPYGKWLKPTRQAWTLFWESPLASVFQVTDIPALRRLFHMYDEEERLRRAVRRRHQVVRARPLGWDGPAGVGDRVVETEAVVEEIEGHLGVGSQGQLVTSPNFAALRAIRQEIRVLEDRLGLTPMARFRMGWQQGEMRSSQARATEAEALAAAAAKIADQHRALRGGS